MTHPVVWFEVMGDNGQKLQSFYHEAFDWQIDANNPMRYGMVEAAQARGIPGGVGQLDNTRYPKVTFYVSTDDIEASLAQVVKLGGKVLIPRTELAEGPTIGLFSDPMFDREEIEALVLGARVAAAFGDASLAKAAGSVISKVEAVLPERLKPQLSQSALFAPRTRAGRASSDALLAIRAALTDRRKVQMRSQRKDGVETERVVRPLGAFFWGTSWTLTAWCELRSDFRLDRVCSIDLTEEPFEEEPGKTLRDFLRGIGHDAERLLDD